MSYKKLLVVLAFLCLPLPSLSKDLIPNNEIKPLENGELLKVGVMNGFNEIELDSLEEIFNKIGLDVEYVIFDEINSLKNNLNHKKVDLALYFKRTGTLDDKSLYSVPILKKSVAYWSISTSEVKKNGRWACVVGTIYCNILESENIQNFQKYISIDSAMKSVSSKEIDAVLASYVTLSKFLNNSDELSGNLQSPDWGGSVNLTLFSKKDNVRLTKIVDEVVGNLRSDREVSINDNNNYYYTLEVNNNKYKTRSDHVIKYSFDDDVFPLLFRNQSGNLTGYLYDILKLIESRTELEFKYIANDNGKSLVEMLTLGDINLIPFTLSTSDYFGLASSTNPVISFRYYALSLAKSVSITSVLEGVLLAQGKEKLGIKTQVFGESVLLFSNPKSILRALESGEIKKAYIREDLVDIIASSDATDDYIVDRKDYRSVDATMAVSNDNKLLLELLNSAFKTWDSNEINKIKNSYDPFNVVYGVDYKHFIRIIAILFILIAVAGVLIYLRQKNLNLQFIIKENDAKNFELEKNFLQCVITQFPSQVFIYDDTDTLLLSSCKEFQSGRCDSCLIRSTSDSNEFLQTKENRKDVLNNGNTINYTLDVNNCAMKMETVEYICMRIKANNKNYVLSIITDITEKKLQERELITAKGKAEKAISIRDKFLASMSHELRTPIAGMVGLLEMLSNRISDEESRVLLSNVSTSARQLNVLVNDILDFSKIDAGQLKLEPRECHILRETGEVVRLHLAAAREKGLTLKYNFSPTPINIISIDSLRYAQILNNLLSNAIKFTDKGSVLVDVSIDNDKIFISIADSGCGMSHDKQKIIFSPFVQADNSIARKYGGTGLGLTIVSELTSLMKGTLKVSSLEGVGTKVDLELSHEFVSYYGELLSGYYIHYKSNFEIISEWLSVWGCNENILNPINKVLISDMDNVSLSKEFDCTILLDSEKVAFKETIGTKTNLSIKPFFPDLLLDTILQVAKPNKEKIIQTKRSLSIPVLVAEDNPINQIVIINQLRNLGIEAELVTNGKEALDALMTKPNYYRLLITDCHMPIMDGFELVRNVREMTPDSHFLKIIGCTAEDSRVVHDTANLVGFDKVLYKPYGIEKLSRIINDLIPDDHWLDHVPESDVEQMRSLFISTMTDDLIELKKENRDNLKRIAHKIKGGASILGIESIVLLAQELEDGIHSPKNKVIPTLIEDLINDVNNHIYSAKHYMRGSK